MLKSSPAEMPVSTLPDIGRWMVIWIEEDNKVYWAEAIQMGDGEIYHKTKQESVKLILEYSEAFRGRDGDRDIKGARDRRLLGLPDMDSNMIVPIRGDSMAPRYPVGCRIVFKSHSFNSSHPLLLPFGEVFTIAARQEDAPPPEHYLKGYTYTPIRRKRVVFT